MSSFLSESENRNVLLIVNPVSGRLKSVGHMGEIVSVFSDARLDVTLHETTGRYDARNYVAENAAKYAAVVSCGGDGTFGEVISGMIAGHHTCPVGCIPAGTTNDFSSALEIPLSLTESASAIVNGMPCFIDAGQFNGSSYFSYIASFGAFTKSSYSTPQQMKNALGYFAYLLEGVMELGSIEPIPLKIKYKNGKTVKEHTGNFIFGAVTNSTSVGGILKYDREKVKLDDGLFEGSFILQPQNIFEQSEILKFLTVRSALHHSDIYGGDDKNDKEDKNIIFFQSPEIEISSSDGSSFSWTTDGEFAGKHKNAYILNLPKAIKILK